MNFSSNNATGQNKIFSSEADHQAFMRDFAQILRDNPDVISNGSLPALINDLLPHQKNW